MNAKRLKTCWHKLPRKTLRELQVKQLRAYLRDVVLPFHPHYGKMFSEHGLDWRAIERLEDLQRIPFTSKSDYQGSERAREFVIAPVQPTRRPSDSSRSSSGTVAPGANSTGVSPIL
jgi:phenylacetate-CoA ligase